MKLAFSAVVSIVLLGIYVYLVVRGVNVVGCISDVNCSDLTPVDFNDRMASSLAMIGGLISGLVIAELSVTEPGEVPAARLVAPSIAKHRPGLMQIITGLYLLVWLLAGLSAYFFGYLTVDPDVLPPLANIGQSWLGVAVGAAYAYFGIRRPEKQSGGG